MTEPNPLTLPDIRRIVNADEVAKGTLLLDAGKLLHLAQHEAKLFCEAQGSSGMYRVSATFDDVGKIVTRCSCPAARFNAICKHAAGLLLAWARAPESFVTSEVGPVSEASAGPRARSGAPRQGTVRKGTTNSKELLAQGVEQASTLSRELAVAGLGAVDADRIGQLRDLAEQLRSNRLRRLSSRTLELAELVEGEPGPVAYADLLTDMVLTVRKLEKHLGGEVLDKRHEEELVGRSWRKADREPVEGLDLLEVQYRSWTTSDEFVVRESRFVDLASGQHLSEKQIIPGNRSKFETPKPSYAGLVLRGAAGGLFPGFAPRRLMLDTAGTKVPVGAADLEAMLARAVPSVTEAMAAYQAHRRDVFAPDGFPVLLATEQLHVGGGRLRVMDASGTALTLAAGRGLQLALGELLRGPRLRAVLGDLWLDGVLPELHPIAVLVEGAGGLELRPIEARTVRTPARARSWQEEARSAGLSDVAVSLGEVRHELAMALMAGLRAVVPRVVEPLAVRLRDLGMTKPIPLLDEMATQADPALRLDPFVKLYTLLGIALVRLAGGTKLEGEVVAVPGLPSMRVSVPERYLSPTEAAARAAIGTVSPYETELHYARWFADHAADEVYPLWADGLARPHLVPVIARHPDIAVDTACLVLESDSGRSARHTAYAVLDAVGTELALRRMERIAKAETDPSLASFVLAMFRRRGRPFEHRGRTLSGMASPQLSQDILGSSNAEARKQAMGIAVACGATACLPAIRQVFHADASTVVQREAMLALAALGDAEVVDDLVQLLDARGTGDERDATAAARALGTLGDARGVAALVRACADGWSPGIVAQALSDAGGVAIGPVLDLVGSRPEFGDRLKAWLGKRHAVVLGGHVAQRVAALEGPEAASQALKWIKIASVNKNALPLVLTAVLALADRLDDRSAGVLRKKVAAHPAAATRAIEGGGPVAWWSGLFG